MWYWWASQQAVTDVDTMSADGALITALAGVSYSIAWTCTGELYTWGAGFGGQLGHGGLDDETLPRLVETLTGRRIKGAAAGSGHTVAWTDTGQLWTWGCGHGGQLGHGEPRQDEVNPRVVQAMAGQRVVMASAINHTLVITATGEVSTFGTGTQGQLGHGSTNAVWTPLALDLVDKFG